MSSTSHPACPNNERLERHERVLFGGDDPERGIVHRFLVIEKLLRWVVGLLGANVVALLGGAVALIALLAKGNP